MKAAIVSGPGKTPVYGNFNDPIPQAGEELISITASALSPLTKGRAAGSHYSSAGKYPSIPGVDGVGRLSDGRRVYFVGPEAPYGAMAEKVAMKSAQCIPIPEGLDDIAAAAIANPGMSSWAALSERARLVAGETVLINGATGSAGRLSIQIAKHLGAAKVIAVGRAIDESFTRSLGADTVVSLDQPPEKLEAAFQQHFHDGVNVVLDYLWGQSALALIVAAAKGSRNIAPIRFVQIGSLGGNEIPLPSAALRSSTLELMGSGLGSVPFDRLLASISGVLQAAASGSLQVETEVVALSDVEKAWTSETKKRIVFTVR